MEKIEELIDFFKIEDNYLYNQIKLDKGIGGNYFLKDYFNGNVLKRYFSIFNISIIIY